MNCVHVLTMVSKVTIPSVCVPLPAAVVDYLLEDGQLVLPSECNKVVIS